jgi:tetratricopeptide (TPR) repeat protein
MTSVFIVRPFGKRPVPIKKDGKDVSVDVDFTAIDRDLIQEALKRNGLDGQTTEAIVEAGNIRVDMFQRLIASDLVIADISIDNANVFYELGIRHGLRPNGTILIRLNTGGRDVPFDLKTDRYIVYDWEKPAAGVDLLARSIKDTIAAAASRDSRADSPVFLLLPSLVPTDPAKLIVVPSEFQDAVEKAESDPANGPTTLALLAEEAQHCAWARGGVRLVGRAQRRMKSFEAARESWEFIRSAIPDDVEANLQLATIFQRLGDLASASQACRRVLENPAADRRARADARSQLARNEKAVWVAAFSTVAADTDRRAQAISDDRLAEAFDGYMAGFAEDLNDYYSGINALGLLTATVTLAKMLPDDWGNRFETKKKADAALDDHQEQLTHLRGAVRMSLENARRQVERGKPDEWLPPSEAQYSLLTADRPAYVKNAYRAAKNAGGSGFSVESEADQVRIFWRLGLFPELCSGALEGLGIAVSPPGPVTAKPAGPSVRDRVIVGTGHRTDAPGRKSPRFPNTEDAIAKAKSWLRQQLEAEKAKTTGAVSAIGGAASGTDLLFHEACDELGIPATVVLAIPKDDYRRQSVMDGGPDWVEKYNRLLNTRPVITLSDSEDLPVWAASIPNYGVFQRGNIWMMENALLRPNADVTLVALWNGQAGDGPGGTADMIKLAQSRGAKVCVKDTDELFGIAR